MSKIFYIMGKSSAGKDTIYKKLLKDEALEFRTVVTYTTRPKREGESEGREYHFVTVSDMERMEKEAKIIEKRSYDTIHGVWNYFTADDGQFGEDGKDLLLIGTLESYEKVKEYFGEERVVPIYVYVDDGIRLMRALKREMEQKNPKYAEMCRRFLADEKDFSEDKIQYLKITERFENDDEVSCIRKIAEYIKKNRQ